MKMMKKLACILILLAVIPSCEEINQTFHLYSVQNQTNSTLTLTYQTVSEERPLTATIYVNGFLNFEDYVEMEEKDQLNSQELAALFTLFELRVDNEVVDFNLAAKQWVYYDGGVTSGPARVHDYRLEITNEDL